MHNRALRIISGLGGVVALVALMPGTVIAQEASEVQAVLDNIWVFIAGCLVFFMQAGFGLLEAGSVRTKNTKNILLKNLLDACMGAIVWWAWGFAAAVKLTTLSSLDPRALSLTPPLRRTFAVRDGQHRQQVHRRHGQGQGRGFGLQCRGPRHGKTCRIKRTASAARCIWYCRLLAACAVGIHRQRARQLE